MNSHYYATRFDKVPNVWSLKTKEKLSKIIEAKQNKNIIKIGFKDEYFDMPYDLETTITFETLQIIKLISTFKKPHLKIWQMII